MTECPSDCKDFTPDSSTKWFKISAYAFKPGTNTAGSTATDWVQAEMNNGSPVSVTIPADLADGNYLFRQEILALQNGLSKGLAEFYPNCVQMALSGGKNSNSSSSQNITPTTTFPGAYTATDPGILVNVYNPGLNYVMPGPAIANIAQGSSNDNSSPPASESGPAATSSSVYAEPSPSMTGTPTEAPAPTGTSKCKNSKRKRSESKRMVKRALRNHEMKRMVQASF